jgi:hypothetical protein
VQRTKDENRSKEKEIIVNVTNKRRPKRKRATIAMSRSIIMHKKASN